VDQFVELLGELAEARKVEQAARVRTDADLLPLMRKAIEPAYPLPATWPRTTCWSGCSASTRCSAAHAEC